jgi:hypothetical protein
LWLKRIWKEVDMAELRLLSLRIGETPQKTSGLDGRSP